MHTLFFWMLCCWPDLNRNPSKPLFASLCRHADLIIDLDPQVFSRRFPWHLQGVLVFPLGPSGFSQRTLGTSNRIPERGMSIHLFVLRPNGSSRFAARLS